LISKIQQLNCILNALICAPTKINPSGSTRAIHLQELTFSKSGKVSGANNWVYGLDVNHLVQERFKKYVKKKPLSLTIFLKNFIAFLTLVMTVQLLANLTLETL
jgi:hypothetical protein